MSEKKQYPSIGEQAKNLANFSWELIQHIHKNQGSALTVSDEVYIERTTICKSCERFDDLEKRCFECGCYVPAKAKIIVDSCPLNKWKDLSKEWEETFNSMVENIETDKKEGE
jgi:UDP-N-acetylmuramate-alanine ligase